jgi:hypothetical protein
MRGPGAVGQRDRHHQGDHVSDLSTPEDAEGHTVLRDDEPDDAEGHSNFR